MTLEGARTVGGSFLDLGGKFVCQIEIDETLPFFRGGLAAGMGET